MAVSAPSVPNGWPLAWFALFLVRSMDGCIDLGPRPFSILPAIVPPRVRFLLETGDIVEALEEELLCNEAYAHVVAMSEGSKLVD